MHLAWAASLAVALAAGASADSARPADPQLEAVLAAVEARTTGAHTLRVRFTVDYSRMRKPTDPRAKLPKVPQKYEWKRSGVRWFYEHLGDNPKEVARFAFDGRKGYTLRETDIEGKAPMLQVSLGQPRSPTLAPELATGDRLAMVNESLLDVLRQRPTRVAGRPVVGGRQCVQLEASGLSVNRAAVKMTLLLDESRGCALQSMALRPDLSDPDVQRRPDDENGKRWFTEVEVTRWDTFPQAGGAPDYEFPRTIEFRQPGKVLMGLTVDEVHVNEPMSEADFVFKPPSTSWVVDSSGKESKSYIVGELPRFDRDIQKVVDHSREAAAKEGWTAADARPPASGLWWKCGAAFSVGLLVAACLLWFRSRRA